MGIELLATDVLGIITRKLDDQHLLRLARVSKITRSAAVYELFRRYSELAKSYQIFLLEYALKYTLSSETPLFVIPVTIPFFNYFNKHKGEMPQDTTLTLLLAGISLLRDSFTQEIDKLTTPEKEELKQYIVSNSVGDKKEIALLAFSASNKKEQNPWSLVREKTMDEPYFQIRMAIWKILEALEPEFTEPVNISNLWQNSVEEKIRKYPKPYSIPLELKRAFAQNYIDIIKDWHTQLTDQDIQKRLTAFQKLATLSIIVSDELHSNFNQSFKTMPKCIAQILMVLRFPLTSSDFNEFINTLLNNLITLFVGNHSTRASICTILGKLAPYVASEQLPKVIAALQNMLDHRSKEINEESIQSLMAYAPRMSPEQLMETAILLLNKFCNDYREAGLTSDFIKQLVHFSKDLFVELFKVLKNNLRRNCTGKVIELLVLELTDNMIEELIPELLKDLWDENDQVRIRSGYTLMELCPRMSLLQIEKFIGELNHIAVTRTWSNPEQTAKHLLKRLIEHAGFVERMSREDVRNYIRDYNDYYNTFEGVKRLYAPNLIRFIKENSQIISQCRIRPKHAC